jgi:energy-coupling factor transport system ATP-binding protein
MPEAETRPTGPLQPIELATASVLALPTVMFTVIGWFLPHLGAVAALGVVPMAVVAYRHRMRALVASAVAAGLLSFLVAGTGTATNIIECAMVGGLVGTARRRKWPFAVEVAGAAVIAAILAALSVGLLLLFSSLRKLTLEQVRSISQGIRRLLLLLPWSGPAGVVRSLADGLVRDWWIAVIASVVVSTFGYVMLVWVLLIPVVARLRDVEQGGLNIEADDRPVQPVPATLRDVRYRYPGADFDALAGVSLDIPEAQLVALVGDNGSGKSTLARLLAGQQPTAGTVERPGAAGLGRPGGTALIMQHPETQVLGVRVADDVVWGLRDASGVDVDGLLAEVGLTGMGDRETSTLSGGELQRLAVAAALARRPRLLISDESTAMVDEAGRRVLVDLLREVQSDHGVSVVHVTHRAEETAGAHHTIRLDRGSVVTDGIGSAEPPAGPAGTIPSPPAYLSTVTSPVKPLRLELSGVSYTYAEGTPWAQPALFDIDLLVEPNDGLLVVGGNGSGKSTLAWIMAGLVHPTQGRCLLGGEAMSGQVGSVGLALQHARLQLQRPKVGQDIRAAGAPDDDSVAAALSLVGLEPSFAERSIDEMSGGQQRRVAIAGLLARRPSVLVLDEPLAGLDDPTRRVLLASLGALRRDHGMTIVVISHDLTGMDEVCDRSVRLDRGRIVMEPAGRGVG